MGLKVGIVAPSSKVPQVELELGAQKLAEAGFEVSVHSQCKASHLFFAGTDRERAEAFFEFASDPGINVVWAARGGSGAVRILRHLEQLALNRGMPARKLFVGFSDSTALAEYVRTRWNWHTLHAEMPALRKFLTIKKPEWDSTVSLIQGKKPEKPWGKLQLGFHGAPPAQEITGTLVGGNLSVWTSLIGTPYAGDFRDKILFLEEVDEYLYRVDRMLAQLVEGNGFGRVRALVVGDFLNCNDTVPSVLAKKPTPKTLKRVIEEPKAKELKPLRKRLEAKKVLQQIFTEISERFRIPVAYGLPVGHGPGHFPLPIGAEYRITPTGDLDLTRWDWLR